MSDSDQEIRLLRLEHEQRRNRPSSLESSIREIKERRRRETEAENAVREALEKERVRKPRGTPRPRGKNADTARNVARAVLFITVKGWTQEMACHHAPVDPQTFRKYVKNPKEVNDPDVLNAMEGLLKDKEFLDELGPP